MKVAYYSPLPPERSGIADYSALLLPALEQRIDVARRAPRPRDARRRPDVALYHVGNDPEAHGWIVEALRQPARRRRPARLRPPPPRRRADPRPRRRGGYLDAMEREAGLAGRLLAHGVLDNRMPPLWETRPQDFPLAGEVLELRAPGLIVHSRYVEDGARARRLRRADRADPASRLAGAGASRRPTSTGDRSSAASAT